MSATAFTTDPAIASVTEQQRSLAARTQNLKIISAEGFTQAAEYLKVVKGNLKSIEDARVRITQPQNEAIREINAQARLAAAPFLEIEASIKREILAWNQEQERQRQLEQRKRDEDARAERIRLQAIADATAAKARQEAEERRKAEERARQEGDEAEAVKQAAAAATIENRAQAKVDTFEERAATTVAPVAQSEAPKVSGVSQRDNWCYRVVDEDKINRPYLMANTTKIGKLVKALKLEARAIIGEGVEVYNDPIITSTRA